MVQKKNLSEELVRLAETQLSPLAAGLEHSSAGWVSRIPLALQGDLKDGSHTLKRRSRELRAGASDATVAL